jgi:hypothetical protein
MRRTDADFQRHAILCANAVVAQSDSTSQIKVGRNNPYHSIKTSIFAEESLGDYIKSGTAIGFEVRKFTGLRHFFFATASISEYHGRMSIAALY